MTPVPLVKSPGCCPLQRLERSLVPTVFARRLTRLSLPVVTIAVSTGLTSFQRPGGMGIFRFIAILTLVLGLAGCGYGGSIPALNFSSAARTQSEKLPGRVYLLRGMIGDIFSLGMDELAEKIERRGITASVHGVSAALYLTDSIVKDYRANPSTAPIVLIGHSTGGDAIISIAHKLKAAKVPVALAFGFDPTPVASVVPSNVDLFINLYQGSNLIGGSAAKPEAGFRGRLINVDLRDRHEIIHITLDKSDAIHDLVVRKIASVAESAVAKRTSVADVQTRASVRSKSRNDARRFATSPGPAYVTPLVMRYAVPPGQTIELWDSAVQATAEGAESLDVIARRTGAPAWAIAQINKLDADHPPRDGQTLLIPRHLFAPAPDLPQSAQVPDRH